MFLILDSHQLNLRFKKKMELPPIDTRSKGMWNFTGSLAYLCSNKLNGEREKSRSQREKFWYTYLQSVTFYTYLHRIRIGNEISSGPLSARVSTALQPAFLVAKLASCVVVAQALGMFYSVLTLSFYEHFPKFLQENKNFVLKNSCLCKCK